MRRIKESNARSVIRNADKIKTRRRIDGKRWREQNPERARDFVRNSDLKKKYGIFIFQYEAILQIQNGVCAICKESCATGMRLAVDHDHATGKVRALLCKNCNTALGLFREDVAIMFRAIEYLEFHSDVKEIA